ncbi:hypothetical protein [Reinekea marinisedimentorum]|uniref:hypothetical protein n=1 Tax=Reinekea marinisedimentorum TaxID=230495 RepID=UPI001047F807|nr:hypothetical protein [Reinekea marinisedimentorum]
MAHHGIQRSGTNYLLACLDSLNVNVINRFDPARNHPSHKHFRWYQNKEAMPPYVKVEFGNSVCSSSLSELNSLAKFPKNTKHIVIKKDVNHAVCSLMNYGLRKNWFANKNQALLNYQMLLNDYRHYYEFWEGLARSSNEVVVVNYEQISQNSNRLISCLNELGADIPFLRENLVFSEVRMSPKTRKKVILIDDLVGLESGTSANSAIEIKTQSFAM